MKETIYLERLRLNYKIDVFIYIYTKTHAYADITQCELHTGLSQRQAGQQLHTSIRPSTPTATYW